MSGQSAQRPNRSPLQSSMQKCRHFVTYLCQNSNLIPAGYEATALSSQPASACVLWFNYNPLIDLNDQQNLTISNRQASECVLWSNYNQLIDLGVLWSNYNQLIDLDDQQKLAE